MGDAAREAERESGKCRARILESDQYQQRKQLIDRQAIRMRVRTLNVLL